MKTWICQKSPFLTLTAALLISSAAAQAMQPIASLTTRLGKTYEDCRVLQEDPDGVYIEHAKGMAKILYADMSERDRNALGYDAEKEKAYNQKRAEKRGLRMEQNLERRREIMQAQMEMQSRMDNPMGAPFNGYGYVPAYNSGVPIVAAWSTGNPFFPASYGTMYPYGSSFAQRGFVPYWGYANGRFGVSTLPVIPGTSGSIPLNVIGTPVHMPLYNNQISIPLGVPALSNGVPPLAPLPQNNVARPLPVSVGRSTIVAHPGGHK
jgi:hypothetical protein